MNGDEQDAYILGIDESVVEFTGRMIAIIHRFDDVPNFLLLIRTK